MMTPKQEDIMPLTDALIVSGIVAAFVIFAIVLAWAEHQTRNLAKPAARQFGDPGKPHVVTTQAKPPGRRAA
jgi:hypothetical protein